MFGNDRLMIRKKGQSSQSFMVHEDGRLLLSSASLPPVTLQILPGPSMFVIFTYSAVNTMCCGDRLPFSTNVAVYQCLIVTRTPLLFSTPLSKSKPMSANMSQTNFLFSPSRTGILSSASDPLKYLTRTGQ